jgi:alpha-glucosidase
MQDPWGIEFAPTFLGRDTCRTPMVWSAGAPNGGFSNANATWLPVSQQHLAKAGLDAMKRSGSVYRAFSQFLKWRKQQSAMMDANLLSDLVGDGQEIAFKRVSGTQTLQCRFNFETLTATFEEL